jgi:hypothetical protein
MHSLLGDNITFIVCFVIFSIGYSCLQWQWKSYKTSETTVMLGLVHLKNKNGGIVRARSRTLPVWIGIWSCEKAPRNWGKVLRTRLCMCKLAFGLVRKLQGTEAKVSGPGCACVIWYLALWERQTSRKTIFKVSRWLCVLQM